MGNLDTGVAGFANGFIQALKDKQDREDRMKESSEDRALRKVQIKMNAAEHGFDVNDDFSSFTQNPDFARKQALAERLKAFNEGASEIKDESGNVIDYGPNPNSYKGRELDYKGRELELKDQEAAAGLVKEAYLPKKGPNGLLDAYASTGINKPAMEYKKDMKLAGSPYAATLDQRQAFQAHQRNILALKKDPVLTKRLNQYQNLDNALSMITQARELTPQQIQEFQQAVRSNMGISGVGGVGEREETYFKTAGLNAAMWKQFLTGDPVSMSKDSKLMDHLRDLAGVEQSNIKKQYSNRIKAVTGGNASIYREHPELQSDLDDLVSGFNDQVQPGGLMTAPAQGMIQDKPKSVIQNGHTYILNEQTGEYE
jgi:hypothetical protein